MALMTLNEVGLAALRQFASQHGHCNVLASPAGCASCGDTHEELVQFTQAIREQHAVGKLSPYAIVDLAQLGFVFDNSPLPHAGQVRAMRIGRPRARSSL